MTADTNQASEDELQGDYCERGIHWLDKDLLCECFDETIKLHNGGYSDYTVVADNDLEFLIIEVNKKIQSGKYSPIGGIQVAVSNSVSKSYWGTNGDTITNTTITYYQSMIKKETKYDRQHKTQ